VDTTDIPQLGASIEIDAPPALVWALVSDVSRMADWSPQVSSVRLKGEGGSVLGARFTNLNKQGELEWVTHGEVVRFEPDREVAFRIEENWVIWSLRLSPAGDGTRLVQRRETPDGISALSRELTDTHLGGQSVFTAWMQQGMTETLAAIKAAAEALSDR
jgi:uncharacterized protein YndB with AHSA1/START domain